jgi:hypothetical protein
MDGPQTECGPTEWRDVDRGLSHSADDYRLGTNRSSGQPEGRKQLAKRKTLTEMDSMSGQSLTLRQEPDIGVFDIYHSRYYKAGAGVPRFLGWLEGSASFYDLNRSQLAQLV